ncbi:glucose dehydrogenase [FAD, quinone] [Bicyclus anynana]|uniref:Glucose dehydrogenase [FAD, quinone] n=1 Tax=Bicyclus anynana TaxID=110368 RepID=A0A6J1P3R3_BICAN|nr:glucose dehydrogenase [FAD, quinone] [Bicyclus anynana]
METLQANITSTCPVPFSGITGDLFLQAVTAVIAAHCSILDGYTWPPDSAINVIDKGSNIQYDFIIVGAGTAGSLFASQLSNIYPSWSILLIEAGDDPGIDSEIPAFLFLNQNSSYDWFYKTYPDGQSCLGFRNRSCIWSKGKGLGGSSSINAMIYLRGHPEDFMDWETSGNNGWGYKDLIKYFEKQEELFNITDSAFPGYQNEWYDVIDKAWEELGFTANNYRNHETIIGTKKARILTQNGKRSNTAKVYFNKLGENVVIMKNTKVEKVLLNKKTKQALGVHIRHQSGKSMDIIAKKEVVLAAGSIATPQLLLLSGIGPRKHLELLNIDCLLNLPVGKNLQDHLFFPLFFKTNMNNELPRDLINILLLQYMVTRTGPFSNIGLTDYMSFINTNNDSDYPDIQFHHTYFTKNDNFVLKPYLFGVGYSDEIVQAIEALNKKQDMLGIYPTLLKPKSRGEILLSKSDLSKPIIKTNYFQHPDDLVTLIKAINFVQKLEKTSSFKALGIELLNVKIQGCHNYSYTDAYWECYIRHMATTVYHPVGTTKMGPEQDGSSVVGRDLIVHGLRNLRIVDASIMPKIPSANTMAATLALAQKAVDIIKGQYGSKDEL